MYPCPHSRESAGYAYRTSRLTLDPILKGIPEQTGGRHGRSCAYCAYERGYKNGWNAARKAFMEVMGSLIKDEPPAPS